MRVSNFCSSGPLVEVARGQDHALFQAHVAEKEPQVKAPRLALGAPLGEREARRHSEGERVMARLVQDEISEPRHPS